MSRLISSHGHWVSIIHEINAKTQPGLIQENLSPWGSSPPSLHPSSTIFLRRLFSLHTSLFCWEWVVRVVNMKTESVHLKGWQPVGDGERETQVSDTQQWHGMCELVLPVPELLSYISWSLIHYSLHDKHSVEESVVSSKARFQTLMNHHRYASLTGAV